MDFLKKHYEKILLGLVLIGLAVAAIFLPVKIAAEKEKLETLRNSLTHRKVPPLPETDVSVYEAVAKRADLETRIELGATNRLFNPMTWQQTRDNRLIRLEKAGPTSVIITNITPLYLRISLDSVTMSDSGARYLIGIQREAALKPSDRGKKPTGMKLNDQNDLIKVIEARGNAEEPAPLVLQIRETGENISVAKDKPYSRVDGYMADMKYDPEKKFWRNQRVGMSLFFNGEEYKIVAINQSEVVLSAPNQKKWTIRFNAPVT
jgi:hypothetical protein